MKHRIYRGQVMHARIEPTRHVFRYPLYFYSFDLDDLPKLNRYFPLTGHNRRAAVSMHDADYLDTKPGTIREKLFRFLREKNLDRDIVRIELITAARFFNYVFNPVSFYYCYKNDGSLGCAVAEVNNTFGERHLYVLDQFLPAAGGFIARFEMPKDFHVSPFNDMNGTYIFQFSKTDGDLDIRIDIQRDERIVFKSQLAGQRIAFTRFNLLKMIMAYPLAAVLTVPRIHFQAAKLYFQKKLRIYTKPKPMSRMTIKTAPPTWCERIGMKAVIPYLNRIETGSLTITLPDRSQLHFGQKDSFPRVSATIKDYKFFWRALRDGDVGFGESYMAGEWETSDLTALLELLIKNRHRMDGHNIKTAWFGRFINRLFHGFNENTVKGSRKNISAHYDLSNDFFRLFLDPSMMYSCALYKDPGETLEQAQINKLHALIKKAKITKDDHVLEIGSGWGAFAIEAVRETGCRVTTITISNEQFDLAKKRIHEAGLEDRIDVKICDYRRLEGQYDKIISIEMLEAVGHEYLGDFFNVCDRVLKPHGLVVIQVITIPDQRYNAYRRSGDWIQKHIFPGGHIPSLEALSAAMTEHSHFVVEHLENIGIHYAKTLREWRERFSAQKDQVTQLGFDEIFVRKWLYYFSYCEAAFATRALNDLHLVLTRPHNPTLNT